MNVCVYDCIRATGRGCYRPVSGSGSDWEFRLDESSVPGCVAVQSYLFPLQTMFEREGCCYGIDVKPMLLQILASLIN